MAPPNVLQWVIDASQYDRNLPPLSVSLTGRGTPGIRGRNLASLIHGLTLDRSSTFIL